MVNEQFRENECQKQIEDVRKNKAKKVLLGMSGG